MKVIVDDKWSYECDFEVHVGDRVVLPSAKTFNTWIGTITGFNSDYKGPMKKVLKIHQHAPRMRSIFDDWAPSCGEL